MWLVKVDSPFYKRLVKFFKSITQEAPANVALLVNKPVFDTLSLQCEPVTTSASGTMNSEYGLQCRCPPN